MNTKRQAFGSRQSPRMSYMPYEQVRYDTTSAPFLSPTGPTEVITITETTTCNPWNNLIYCPLYLYIIVSLIGFYLTWQSLAGDKKSEGVRLGTGGKKGDKSSGKSPQTNATIIGLAIYSIISLIFGMIIYNQCKKCDTANAWLWFIIALLAPFLFVSLTLGILAFVFGFAVGWTGTKDAKKGKKGVNSKKNQAVTA